MCEHGKYNSEKVRKYNHILNVNLGKLTALVASVDCSLLKVKNVKVLTAPPTTRIVIITNSFQRLTRAVSTAANIFICSSSPGFPSLPFSMSLPSACEFVVESAPQLDTDDCMSDSMSESSTLKGPLMQLILTSFSERDSLQLTVYRTFDGKLRNTFL